MVRTKLFSLPFIVRYGLLEETADCWKRQHNKRQLNTPISITLLGCFLFINSIFGADLFIIRHWRESTHPAGITPQGFLQTNTLLWLCFGKVEDCFRSQLPFKGRNNFQIFQWGFLHARAWYIQLQVQPIHEFFRTSNQKIFLISLDTHLNLRSMWIGKNWKLNPLPIQKGVEQIGNRQEV